MSTPRVTALLVVHDGVTWLPEVVASITSQTRSPDRILAIDTGSLDASAKLLKGARIPTVTTHRSTPFASAISFGIEQLPAPVEGVEEWLWILHDDCALEPGALQALLDSVADRPNIAMVGPKLLGWHDRTHLLEVGISIATNGARWTELETHEYDQGQHDGVHEVLSVSTAGALIRRNVFEELGGFDSNLELFRDDVDFGWRLHVAGFGVLAVSDAVGYHAQAAASERRAIDVSGAFLHRPLLLDRQNAAYVLLANASWWKLPMLALQLLAGALVRAIGYLFAKLPGYASDELLAITALIFHPAELLLARRDRKRHRLVSISVVKQFIPSRWTQLRSATNRTIEEIRAKLLPDIDDEADDIPSELELSSEDEMLVPVRSSTWITIVKKPLVLALLALSLITLGWARHRFGAISGGGLAQSPGGARDLFTFYVESWHSVGLGSNVGAPVWVLPVALGSILTFGNVALFISLFFIAAPFLALLTSHQVLKQHTTSPNLSAGASFIYALSPVMISAINSGRLGTVIFLIALPIFIHHRGEWLAIEQRTIRSSFGLSLFIAFLAAYNPSLLLVLLVVSLYLIFTDFQKAKYQYRNALFLIRLGRRLILLITPGMLLAPTSLSYLLHPSRILQEIGIGQTGGVANLVLLANPGGAGSLPWWSISPITLLLIVTFFSIADAQKYARYGLLFLFSATLASSIPIHGNGSTDSLFYYTGPLIAVATFLALIAAVIMFTNVRERLEQTHINYQHFAVALVLIATLFYSTTASLWAFSAGAASPAKNSTDSVLPAFLAVDKEAKILVIRPITELGDTSLQYYIARGGKLTLGHPDIALPLSSYVKDAVESLIDGTGTSSSSTLSTFGIKYVFVTKSVRTNLIQTIDGIGGFNRTSATDAGTVWKVAADTGPAILTDLSGARTVLEVDRGKLVVPRAGILTITEHYSKSWQALQDGVRLEKVKNDLGIPEFKVSIPGEVLLLHDGTIRRAWISLFLITLISSIVMALPSGRRRREMSDRELS